MSQPNVSDSATLPSTVDLITFCRVVDLGSMTAAAVALGESKGTVSRRMARLEEHVGTSLLRRQGRRVEPTDEGRVYRDRVGVAVDVLDEAQALLRCAHDRPAGRLRVTAPPGLGPLVGPLLPAFLEAYPAIDVELVLTENVLSFTEHRVDVAFRLAERLPDSSLVARRVLPLTGVLVASPAYLDRRGVPRSPEDLLQHDILAVPVASSQCPTLEHQETGERRQIELAARVLTHDLGVLRDLAVSGAGITVALLHTVANDLADGRLARVLPTWCPMLGQLYLVHAGGMLAPKVRVFRDHVRAALAGDGSSSRQPASPTGSRARLP